MRRIENGGRVIVERKNLVQVAFFDSRVPGCVLFLDSAQYRGSLSDKSLDLPTFYPNGENRRNGLRPIDDLGDLNPRLTLGRIVRLVLDGNVPTLTRTEVIATPANEGSLKHLADGRKCTYVALGVVLSRPASLVNPDLVRVLNHGEVIIRAMGSDMLNSANPVVIRRYPSQQELNVWLAAKRNGKV